MAIDPTARLDDIYGAATERDSNRRHVAARPCIGPENLTNDCLPVKPELNELFQVGDDGTNSSAEERTSKD
jgi:hypothetical protein